MSELLRIPIGLLPVLVFLAALVLMDSFKLVSMRRLLASMAAGIGAALVGWWINLAIARQVEVSDAALVRYVAPLTEEFLKSLWVVWLVRSRRVGFMVDAAIHGFAVGTGFALLENLYYAQALTQGSVYLWIVRGFGTAVLHGMTTALFGILSKALADRGASSSTWVFLPGFLLAYAIHSLFNHFILPPLASTAVLLVVFPVILFAVFDQSERITRRWLGQGLDTDLEIHELIQSGTIQSDPIGQYLQALKTRFPATVVADMLCLLQLHTELSMRAKALLLARQAGLRLPPEPEDTARLQEIGYLEKSIGRTGRLAVDPLLRTSHRDAWQRSMLER